MMKQKTKARNSIRYPLTMPRPMHAAFAKIAQETDTSMNVWMLAALQAWLDARPDKEQGE